MADDTLTQLAEIRATLARLEAAIAGVATNVDIAKLGRDMRRLGTELATMREEMSVQTAAVIRIDNTVTAGADQPGGRSRARRRGPRRPSRGPA